MRQRVRRTIIIILFLLFPIVMNYISPYVSISGAAEGFVTISVLMFALMFLSAIIFGRAWCAWVCPVAALMETSIHINSKRVNVRKLKIIRYSIYCVWFAILVAMFVLAGGIKGINPFYMTDYGISVNRPEMFVIYYSVLFTILIVNITVGKRGSCHSFCWMSPFMSAGYHVGKFLRLPRMRVVADKSICTSCGICDKNCQMSLDVKDMAQKGVIDKSECIFCCECIDNCPKKTLKIGFYR